MSVNIHTKIKDILSELESVTGINQKEELKEALINKGLSISDSDNITDMIIKINDTNLGNATTADVIKDKTFSSESGLDQKGIATLETVINNDPDQLNKLDIRESVELVTDQIPARGNYGRVLLINGNGNILYIDYINTDVLKITLYDKDYNQIFSKEIPGNFSDDYRYSGYAAPVAQLNNGISTTDRQILTNDYIYILYNSAVYKYDLSGNLIYTHSISITETDSRHFCGFGYYNGYIYFAYYVNLGTNIGYSYRFQSYIKRIKDNSTSQEEALINFICGAPHIWISSTGEYIICIKGNGGDGINSLISVSTGVPKYSGTGTDIPSYFCKESKDGSKYFGYCYSRYSFGDENTALHIYKYYNSQLLDLYGYSPLGHVDGGEIVYLFYIIFNNFLYTFYVEEGALSSSRDYFKIIKINLDNGTTTKLPFNISLRYDNITPMIHPITHDLLIETYIYKFKKEVVNEE